MGLIIFIYFIPINFDFITLLYSQYSFYIFLLFISTLIRSFNKIYYYLYLKWDQDLLVVNLRLLNTKSKAESEHPLPNQVEYLKDKLVIQLSDGRKMLKVLSLVKPISINSEASKTFFFPWLISSTLVIRRLYLQYISKANLRKDCFSSNQKFKVYWEEKSIMYQEKEKEFLTTLES